MVYLLDHRSEHASLVCSPRKTYFGDGQQAAMFYRDVQAHRK